MDKRALLEFLHTHHLAVQSSVSPTGSPQGAVLGFVVTDDFQIFFDTLDTTRKIQNLRRNPKIAFVIGGLGAGDERTAQYEGVADEPQGAELARLKELYFVRFPDGPERQAWPGILYVRARPTWIRFSDYTVDPSVIVEFGAEQLREAARQ